MKAHIFLMAEKPGDEKLLAVVQDLEVVPRGIYVIDDQVYEYTGQPTFIIKKSYDIHGNPHVLDRVELTVRKDKPPSDLLG